MGRDEHLPIPSLQGRVQQALLFLQTLEPLKAGELGKHHVLHSLCGRAGLETVHLQPGKSALFPPLLSSFLLRLIGQASVY